MISGKKIFVFDDDEKNLWVLREIFQACEMEVRTVSLFDRVLHEIVEFTPDLLLINVQLKNYDGRTLCYHLKQAPQTKGIPIIMMSDSADISMVDGVPCKADLLITKPFVIKDFLDKANNLMNQGTQFGD